MRIDTLSELEQAFEDWRRNKRYVREPMPRELVSRAHRTAQKHGVRAVVEVTRVGRSRLFRGKPSSEIVRVKGAVALSQEKEARPESESPPTFSRFEMGAWSTRKPHPVAEVETSGVTLRVFEQTEEMLELLSSVCGLGGER